MRHLLLILFLLADIAAPASAQTTNQVPDALPDYSTFSQFISVRNIFNPDRYPLLNDSARPKRVRSNTVSLPYISLVGTMNYPKGMFAFFDGNVSDYRKVLQTNGQIAAYTVKAISATGVTLVSATTNVLHLSIGAQLQQNGTNWILVGANDAANPLPETAPASATDTSTTPAATPDDSSSAPNDVLKRLMQQREQSLK